MTKLLILRVLLLIVRDIRYRTTSITLVQEADLLERELQIIVKDLTKK